MSEQRPALRDEHSRRIRSAQTAARAQVSGVTTMMQAAVAIPDYQTLMRPFLALFEDGEEHAVSHVRAMLAGEFALTDAEQAEMLPSGKGRMWNNRVGWAATYLYRSGLLERPRRSVYRITDRGRDVLAHHPQRVDNDVLGEFEEFRQFRFRAPSTGGSDVAALLPSARTIAPPDQDDQTPEERMDVAHAQLRSALAAELVDRIMEQDFAFFERLVMDVLGAMGYGRGQQLGGSGDEGFDGVINEDRLGLDRIYVQAKRWTDSVGRPAVQGFVGALAGRGATKGVFITTSTFSSGAKTFAEQVQARVILIDGQQLAQLMIEYDVGVSLATRYDVQRVDLDCFSADDEPSANPGEAPAV
jgi:restriction system protein